MILCATVGIEPSLLCYEMCVLAYRCGALKAWEREMAIEALTYQNLSKTDKQKKTLQKILMREEDFEEDDE